MLTWGQQSANSSVPHLYLMTLSGALLPFIHALKSCPCQPCPSMLSRHRSTVLHMLEGSERFMNWVCTFLCLSLASCFSPILCKNCPVFTFSWTLPYLFFSFSWTFRHLLNSWIYHNLLWALVLINSCMSVGVLYYFFTYSACFTWICCYPVSWITSPFKGLP